MATRIGIVGYGNIGKGVYNSIKLNQELHGDISLEAIISRRPKVISKDVKGIQTFDANSITDIEEFSKQIDVAILCGGSATDLPKHGSLFSAYTNIVDSFDNHKKIPGYHKMIDSVARYHGHVAVISTGWDPGTFSVQRYLADAFLPNSNPAGFYGLSKTGGLSMGHSDAIRRIKGVKDARQYTHAIPEAVKRAKKGEKLTPSEMHWRDCKVVIEKGADKDKIKAEIINMPDYFAPYMTKVEFISQTEMDEKYSGMPHDGIVIATSLTGNGNRGVIEYKNQWQSNPEGTANIMVACARAAHKINKEGQTFIEKLKEIPGNHDDLLEMFNDKYFGAKTIIDVLPFVSPRSKEYILKKFM